MDVVCRCSASSVLRTDPQTDTCQTNKHRSFRQILDAATQRLDPAHRSHRQFSFPMTASLSHLLIHRKVSQSCASLSVQLLRPPLFSERAPETSYQTADPRTGLTLLATTPSLSYPGKRAANPLVLLRTLHSTCCKGYGCLQWL